MKQKQTKKKTKLDIREISSSERVFQLDRDSFLIYVGLHIDDSKPFVRTGSGRLIPEGILRHINSVILSTAKPINIGKELEWVEESLRQGVDKVHYIGEKDTVVQLQKLVARQYSKSKVRSKKDGLPIETELFGPPNSKLSKKRITVNQMENGNFLILSGTSRIFDYYFAQRGKKDLDDEYELMEETLKKQPCRLEREDRRSFLWLGEQASIDGKRPSIYWNFKGKGVLLNPSFDFHHSLFEERIRPNGVMTFLSHSGSTSGFIEGMRRQNNQESPVALFTGESDITTGLKKFYTKTKPYYLHDGNAIPFVPDTAFFASKANSNGVFSWRLDPEQDKISQVLFPIGGPRPRRGFDFLKAPHDVEIQTINTREDLSGSLAHLALQIPGDYSRVLFEKERIRSGRYPLIPHKEYVFHQSLQTGHFMDGILSLFAKEPYYEILRDFLLLHASLECNPNLLTKAFQKIKKIKVPFRDFTTRNNLISYLNFVQTLPAYPSVYLPSHKRLLKYLHWKFIPVFTSYKSWLNLEKEPIEFHIFLLGGTKAFLFTKKIPAELIAYKMPPSFEVLKENPHFYPRLLRSWGRAIDRSQRDTRGLQLILETLEKFYEEKLRILVERTRFTKLVLALGLDMSVQSPSENVKARGTLGWLQNIIKNKLKITFPSLRDSSASDWLSKILSSASPVIGIVAITLLLLFTTFKMVNYLTSSVSPLGDSSAEILAVQLVKPGNIQKSIHVPGEGSVETPVQEITQYVNSLARNNGFQTLDDSGNEKLKDINLVFPGDILRLPDKRLAKVDRGSHIFEMSRAHYKKDYARIQILQRQIVAILDGKTKNKLSSVALRRLIKQKQSLMSRLAVTSGMRSTVSNTNAKIRKKRKI